LPLPCRMSRIQGMRGYAHKALGVLAGWLFWVAVLFAIVTADKYHLLDWTGTVPAQRAGLP
jgi:hypothetical protein